jgi:hypothetical protein
MPPYPTPTLALYPLKGHWTESTLEAGEVRRGMGFMPEWN